MGIHSGSGASLTSFNANEINTDPKTGTRSTGRRDTLNAQVQGKRHITQGPGKRKGTGRGTISQEQPSSKRDPRVRRTQRNMADMNRAFKKDMGKVSKPAVTKAPAKGGLSVKPLINTLAKQGEPTSMQIKKLGVERFADRKGMTQIAKTHVARRAPEVAARAVGRTAVKAVPYVGTAVTSAQLGYAAGKIAQSATAKKPVSGTSMAAVNPRGMHASQVNSAVKKLKKRK